MTLCEHRKGKVFICRFSNNWNKCISSILDASGFEAVLRQQKQILIKPNLVEALKPPITTPVELTEALVSYIRERTAGVDIAIGEGTGAAEYDTQYVFNKLGYTRLAEEKSVKLIDLNKEPLVKLTNPKLSRWQEIYLPGILFDSFIISVPVLKAHSLADVTLTMKNMMGAAPPSHYQKGGHWKKSAFHQRMQESILDLNRYRTPDFTILDATIGMKEAHLWGPVCDPHPNIIAAGFDPVAIDAYGAELLKKDWKKVGYIRTAHGELGIAEPLDISEEI
ncbi:MAG: hypothetical protein A2073_04585 [Deltaproteobacteria bacterium GWC2_42_11]|nr:MAG: hypothetical protein A2073_04585 [Deltaproteobacteria bacterium GWC2_42_11]